MIPRPYFRPRLVAIGLLGLAMLPPVAGAAARDAGKSSSGTRFGDVPIESLIGPPSTRFT